MFPSLVNTRHGVIAIGMERSLPVTVELKPGATVQTVGELKHAVTAIAGSEISKRVGSVIDYSYLGQIHNMEIDTPSGALSSPAKFPGVYIF